MTDLLPHTEGQPDTWTTIKHEPLPERVIERACIEAELFPPHRTELYWYSPAAVARMIEERK